MKRRVAILVGHHGPGTGASFDTRDEWTYSMAAAGLLSNMLVKDGIEASVVFIDHRQPMWVAVSSELGEKGGLKVRNQEIRAKWAATIGVDCAVELHMNSAVDHDVAGHEVIVDDDEPVNSPSHNLAKSINTALGLAFPGHPNRGVKLMKLQVLDMLRTFHIPCCLVEPAFLFEDLVADERAWRENYTAALFAGIKTFLAV